MGKNFQDLCFGLQFLQWRNQKDKIAKEKESDIEQDLKKGIIVEIIESLLID